MHGFVRKGLLLSAATGTLVMGYAGTAAAQGDSAVTRGAAADSPGAVSGNVAQVPADVPIQVCGDSAAAAAAMTDSDDDHCRTSDTTAEAEGFAADSPGAVSGNVASVAANVPVQACGIAAGAVAADTTAQDDACVDDGTHAVAKGFAADSPGLASGNVLQLAADVPVQACGDSVGVLAFGTRSEDDKCVNGGGHEMTPPPPVMAPPPVENCPPPVENCPPPPPGPCPPPESGTWTPRSGSDAASPSYSSDPAAPSGDTGTAPSTIPATPAELAAPAA